MADYGASSACTRRGAVSVLCVLVSGCVSLAPAPVTPPLPVAADWPADAPHDPDANVHAPELPWERYFVEPSLQQLIQSALRNNRDLRIAVLRVEEARAAYRISRADAWPTLAVGMQASRARVPGDLNLTGHSLVSGDDEAYVGISSWELDLWGRVRDLKSGALETYLATDAARAAVRVSLIAQVADGYLGLRELDERVALARRTEESRAEAFRIFTRRHDVGAISKLELTEVQTLLTQAQALRTQLEQARAIQAHALGRLVGDGTDALTASGHFDDAAIFGELQVGLPSRLLVDRPDIMASEHQLRAADFSIGAARAAFFPRIALTATWGTASAELDGLFDAGSRAWTFVPTFSLPIFDGGRRRANLDVTRVRREIAVADYERTVQNAFREVADALAARQWLDRQVRFQRMTVDTQIERARLAQLRYDSGAAPYLEVLDAQRALLAAEQEWVQARRALLSSRVALYAALGGGAGVDVAPSYSSTPATAQSR
ncbi:NodT family efflux transporter outer membrane factor (OMF) lipoprotein [Luteibacter jiangsuensis]|uniref:NodT family efflux transporter outer membrane factor (OMF) lipoprotein n=1 Tax=Luteibacter jiangsuensis TaxID=637577 RepID=A0ABT9SV91_9GAMM|nr:efflux transporter outer membrane subunit [Luteibacter jiangsuensis]MDQ0007897.1 NodT family efflux transporter outer membrane factor (OMF) lipoprotein [Luteibacter jiangsuensis]